MPDEVDSQLLDDVPIWVPIWLSGVEVCGVVVGGMVVGALGSVVWPVVGGGVCGVVVWADDSIGTNAADAVIRAAAPSGNSMEDLRV